MKKYINKNKRYLIAVIIFAMLTTIFAVLVQFVKGKIVDDAIDKNFSLLVEGALFFIGFVIVENITVYLYDQFRMKYALECDCLLRQDYFKAIMNRTIRDYKTKLPTSYLAKFSNELELIKNMYFTNMTLLIFLVIKLILVSFALFILDWKIAVITLILLTMPLYVPKLVEKRLIKAQSDYIDKLNYNMTKINDWLNNFENIKMFNIENKIQNQFTVIIEQAKAIDLKARKINNITTLISALMSYFSHIIILLVSIYFVYLGYFSVGMFMSAIGLIDQLSYPIISISKAIQNFVSTKQAVNNILIEINNYKISNQSNDIKHLNYNIMVDHIDFGYDDKLLFKQFSINFERGKKYLIIGKSGSGKSTLIQLLLNFYDVGKGIIKYDNQNITDINPLSYVSLISQDALLLNDSLDNNLTMYADYPLEVKIKSLKAVKLDKYATKEGLTYNIGDNGSNLSGGEAKRLCLARALLCNRDVLIFDEPLANLDYDTSQVIEDLLLNLQDKTVIVVSHQFSEVKRYQFDKIIDSKDFV